MSSGQEDFLCLDFYDQSLINTREEEKTRTVGTASNPR